MRKLALSNLRARPMRALLTGLAVVLGVAMIAAALTVGAAMKRATDSLSSSAYANTAAAVSPPTPFDPTADGTAALPTIPAALVDRVRAVPGVAVASGDLTDQRTEILDARGKTVGSGPYFGVGADPALGTTPFRLTRGRWAAAADEVVIDAGTAEAQHLAPGARVRIQARGPVLAFTVVGTATFGAVRSLGGATFAVFTLPTAQAILASPGRVQSILVRAAAGVSAAALQARLRAALPAMRVQSAAAQDRFALKSLRSFVSVIEAVLLGFGLIAVFVGGFTIANAQSITVAQRSRELAALRALGATRRQLLAGLLAEGALTGLLGAALGVLGGLALAKGLLALLSSLSMSLPATGTHPSAGAIALAVAVGTLVSTLGGLGAAIRATRTSPVLAMRDGADALPATPQRLVSRAAWVFTPLALAALAAGMFAPGMPIGSRLSIIGLGCLLLFTAAALLAPRVAVPIASLLGRPAARLAGQAGALARLNAMRNPRRTASTAAALMIGVALVVFVSSLAAGLKGSAAASVVNQVRTPYVVSSPDGFTTFDPSVEAALAHVAGASVTGIRVDQVSAFGRRTGWNGVDPARFGRSWKIAWRAGSSASLAALAHGGAVLDEGFARTHHLRVGDPLAVTSTGGRTVRLTVSGIARAVSLNVPPLGKITVDERLLDPRAQDKLVLASGPRGGLQAALSAYPTLTLYTAASYASRQTSWIDSMAAVFDVLLALAVIISLLGIANTLGLSVLERKRELGVLRALGMTRRQTRRMIRHEGVITALLGAALGILVGIFLAALVTAALHGQGLRFVLPVGSLIAFAVIAGLAGVLASSGPARRAARLAPLDALAHH
jgi:putative ABC transport system permease protein